VWQAYPLDVKKLQQVVQTSGARTPRGEVPVTTDIIEHDAGKDEKLIAFADAYEDDMFFMQEFVADGEGRYFFYDCVPVESTYWRRSREIHKVFYNALQALLAWERQTGQHISQRAFFRELA